MSNIFDEAILRVKRAGLELARKKLLLDTADENSRLHLPQALKLGIAQGNSQLTCVKSTIPDFDRRFATLPLIGEIPDVVWNGYPAPHPEDRAALCDAEQTIGKIQVNATSIQVAVVAVLHLLGNNLKLPFDFSASGINGRLQIAAIGCGGAIGGIQHFVFAPDAPVIFSPFRSVQEYDRCLVVNVVRQPVLRLPGRTTSQSTLWYYPDSTTYQHVKVADARIPTLGDYPALLVPRNRVPYESLDDLHLALGANGKDRIAQPGDLVILWQPAADHFLDLYPLELVPGHDFDITYSLFVHRTLASHSRFVAAFIRLFIMGWNFLRACRERATELIEGAQDYWEHLLTGSGIRMEHILSCHHSFADSNEPRQPGTARAPSNASEPPSGNPSEIATMKEPFGSSSKSTTKQRTQRGDARDLLIAALTTHHKYGNGVCLNHDPIGNNELASMAKVSRSTASAFFAREFDGYRRYKNTVCSDSRMLVGALRLLNEEYSPKLLFDRRLREETYDDG